jgi:L-aminopeptidase/D-esterase-like protein
MTGGGSALRNLLTDIPGIAVGHATDLDLGSGVTAIIFDTPAVASGVVLGGAPGSRDTALLEPEMTRQQVDAFVFSGGSVYGLDAAGGVQAALREQGRGMPIAGIVVPIVPQAIIFDLVNGGNKDWGVHSPYRELGLLAARGAAHGAFDLGTAGAGTGATTATLKGGLGSASAIAPTGHVVAALAVVNAVGSATIGDGPHFWSAPFEVGSEFGGLGWPGTISPSDVAPRLKGLTRPAETATTVALIATDASLTKAQVKRLAIMANDGLARAILPAHAPFDGDTVFAAATGAKPLGDERDLVLLGHVATQVMARSIARGVYEAVALPYPNAIKGWKERFSPR